MMSTHTERIPPSKSCSLFFVIIFVFMTTEASAYWTAGQVGAGAGPYSFATRYTPQSQTCFLSDDMVASGAAGSLGESHIYADLAAGSLGASVYARGGHIPPGGYFYGEGTGYVGMMDTLNFTVQPGSYTSDLEFTIYGVATGVISTTLDGQAGGSFSATLSSAYNYENAVGAWKITEPQTIMIDEPFSLSVLLFPGGVYDSPIVSKAEVSLSLGNPAGLIASANWSNAEMAGLYLWDTLEITAMDVPDGVTWTSDSGVFMSEPPIPVAEPATVLLLGSGLIALAGFRLRARARRPGCGRR